MKIQSIPWARVRQRAGGLAFALVLNAILLLALFTLAPNPEPRREEDRNPVSFVMAPSQKADQQRSKAQKSEKQQEREAAARQADPVVRPPVPVDRPTDQPPSPFPFLTLDRDQMASADIGAMPQKATGDGSAGDGSSKAVAGPGEGPGGVQLFEAEWYRPPSDAELSSYLPANVPPQGYGLVACKTVDHYHVENCQALGESPPGSGFARAVRLAAWQFLVRPPRVNGKAMVGSWVRIRIVYSRTVVSEGSDGAGE